MKKNKVNSAKNKVDEELPGYPHYPSSEDILNTAENKTERVPVDLENVSRSVNPSTTINNAGKLKGKAPNISDQPLDPEGRVDLVPGNDADVTADDLLALGDKDLNMDMGEDDQLRDRVHPLRVGDSGLDVPGAELDDENEMLGSEDEENNYYSKGDTL